MKQITNGVVHGREDVNEHGWRWQVLGDPDGNEFCVLQPPAGHRLPGPADRPG